MTDSAESTRLEVMVTAAATGHDLGTWQPYTGASDMTGSQAVCGTCGQSVAVRDDGLMWSLLSRQCGIDDVIEL